MFGSRKVDMVRVRKGSRKLYMVLSRKLRVFMSLEATVIGS